MKTILDHNLSQFPESAFDLFFKGRYHQLSGDIDGAVEHFKKSINVQSELKQLHNVANWDLLWCYALRCDWRRAADLAANLRDTCRWSPATNAYQYACFLQMIMDTEGRSDELQTQVDQAMAAVEPLRTRYGGKTLPPEKFAITMAQRYCEGDQIALPALMLFYIWNIFGHCRENPHLMEPLLNLINKKLSNDHIDGDQHYSLMLLKGVCLRNYRHTDQAIMCFKAILKDEKLIEKETHIVPHATVELGLTLLDIGNLDDAKLWLEKARDNYNGFLIETAVHLRIHGALQKVRRLRRPLNNNK